jgi:hypothetical protein
MADDSGTDVRLLQLIGERDLDLHTGDAAAHVLGSHLRGQYRARPHIVHRHTRHVGEHADPYRLVGRSSAPAQQQRHE